MQLHELQLKALNGRAATPPPQETPSQQTPTTSNGMTQFFATLLPAGMFYHATPNHSPVHLNTSMGHVLHCC